MICPKCGDQHYHYIEKRIKGRVGDKKWKRSEWAARCGRCGFEAKEK